MKGIEVHAYGKLFFLFKERNWPNPLFIETGASLTAVELRDKLAILPEDVEAVFVNRQVKPFSTTLQDGDRVAFVPPGVPSIHRFNLGFYAAKEEEKDPGARGQD
ncbi:MAG: MoaD/ThiS family protein [Bacillota bacterium]